MKDQVTSIERPLCLVNDNFMRGDIGEIIEHFNEK